MDWKLFDKDGNFLQEVNCQYDALDMSTMFHSGVKVLIDFEKESAYIVETEDGE